MTHTITRLGPSAAAEMAEIMRRAYLATPHTGGRPWEHKQLSDQLAQEMSYALGITNTDTGALTAFVLYQQIIDEAEILILAVDPTVQRQGNGQRLMDAVLAQLEEQGCRNLFLEVACNNEPAINLYVKFGLRVTGERRGYYQGLDALVMGKSLNST
ncbi:MAG TPA: ribosomal-protein-alanine acetyltransferase [Rhodospirillaceae bacterium]|nr:ribosomal-protein-alanine acetyltransferase [Alphaproteobacteria bacterium]OUT41028.1 MAG: hypothetical protein CBB62_01290 [Micavibrio sp. TMED2]HCI46006.1 ribosomal-protein-alanine acetyltransferase [Rhodospirillaceae bacterium]MAS47476.1 ribosomal-protein-alanine acetyltransferase [Alphaproteobacteria bacterium]MAX96652.1 ribosomal-protein-alanine acetyltransferase [Alphaproteobacteria bacterium]|tara:strand:- start:1008 stop:1478 length:471 start_codon:yes stop_codon:yes gene_type:complete